MLQKVAAKKVSTYSYVSNMCGKKSDMKRSTSNFERTAKKKKIALRSQGELDEEWTEAGWLQIKSCYSQIKHLFYGEKELERCSVVQSPFSSKYRLHFIWKSLSRSLEEEWRDINPCCLKSSVLVLLHCARAVLDRGHQGARAPVKLVLAPVKAL